MDAGANTPVTASANTYDKRSSEADGGCPPFGCHPEKTRDLDLDELSRWSCEYALANEPCNLCFDFGDPQDIVRLDVAMLNGDERTRSFIATASDSGRTVTNTYTFTSSGGTTGYESYDLGTVGTSSLCLRPITPDYYKWLSITEVIYYSLRCMVAG